MKRFISLTSILVFFYLGIFAQSDGDFQSRQTGNWNDFNTWQRYNVDAWQNATSGQIPTSTNAVAVLSHTVTIAADAECANLTINGTLQGDANTLSVYGNLTNNGILDLYSSSGTALVFAGTGHASFSGTGTTTDIHTIEINKNVLAATVQLNTTNFSVHGITSSAPKFLTITTGTFKLSGSFAMSSQTFLGAADSDISLAADESFWLQNDYYTVQAQDGQFQIYATLKISAGVLNVGTTSPQRLNCETGSSFHFEGGTINVSGSFYSSDGDVISYNQSGGILNIASETVTNGEDYCMRIRNASSTFTMSGGTINIIQTNSADREYGVETTEANTNITGGTLNIGTSATAGDFNFQIQGRMPNLVIDNTSNAKMATPSGSCYVYGDFTVNSGATFTTYQTPTTTTNRYLDIYGNLIATGNFDGFNEDSGKEARLFVRFRGTTNTSITGTSATCEFYELTVNKGADMTATLEVLREITINEADGNDRNRLYVENGTFKLSSNSNLTPYSNSQWINSTTGRFWLNHTGAVINWANTGSAQSRGEFIIDAGTFNAGNSFLIDGASTVNNKMNGGTINTVLDFDIEQNLLMTGGTIDATRDFLVDANGGDEYGNLSVTNGSITAGRRLYISGKLEMDLGTITVGDGDDFMQVYDGGTLQLDGGDIIINGYTQIIKTATANNQINGGTLAISGKFDMEQDVLISSGIVTVGGNFYMDGDEDNETGDLTITGGTLNVGNGNDLFQATGNGDDNGEGGSFTMSNGTVNVYGQVSFQNGTGTEVTSFAMTGGNFNIDPQRTDVGGTNLGDVDVFQIQYNTDVNFTGGTLTFIDPKATSTGWNQSDLEILNNTTPGTRNFAGSTIVFGDGGSTNGVADKDFTIRCYQLPVDLGNIIINNPNAAANNRIVRVYDQNITIQNLTITDGIFDFNGRGGTRGKEITIYENVINNGEINGTDANSTNGYCHLKFAGTVAQTYSGTGTFTANLPELTFNNTSSTGVTLTNDIGATTINLTDGHVYTNAAGSGLLTVSGTSPANLVGGTDANYIQGPLRRAIPNNASAVDYDFPVGKTDFRMVELFGISTTGTGTGYLTAEFFNTPIAAAATGGSGMAHPLATEGMHWKIINELSSVSLDALATVRLTYPVPNSPPPVYTMAQSNTKINGTYDAIGRILTTSTIQSEEFKTAGRATKAITYLCIGAVEPLEGTYYVGLFDAAINPDNTRFYDNLTAVADELRIKYVKDIVVFEMLNTYTDNAETFPVDFNTLMKVESDDAVVIRPRAGVTNIETSQNSSGEGAIIYINNIDALTFDGRPNGAGTNIEWTFAHNDATPSNVFEFINDANNNKLSYLKIQSDVTETDNGIIKFGTTTGTNGNDNNTIEYCNITGLSSTPTIGIYSAGTSDKTNSGNIVNACNIYDFFSATEDPKGIYLGANNTDWTISNNKLYQTAQRDFTENQTYYGISINSGYNYTIAGNIIGYSSNTSTGFTDITSSNSSLCDFKAIYLNTVNGNASDIINNIISGIKFNSYSTNAVEGFFSAVCINGGDADVGTSENGNTIGSVGNFATYPIQITSHGEGARIIPIWIGAAQPVSIRYNNIGGFDISANNVHIWFVGVYTNKNNAKSDYTISNNVIGSTTQSNSINMGLTGDTYWKRVHGIYNYRSDVTSISNNTIANITNNSISTGGENRLCGIYADGGTNTINNNEIYNLTTYSRLASNSYSSSIVGIARYSASENQQIINNKIYGLKNNHDDGGGTNDAANIKITGIVYRSCETQAADVSRNFIHNFSTHSTNEDATFTGIYITGTTKTDYPDIITNNMIQLGFDENGTAINQPLRMYGINYNIDAPIDFYHNSIYIGGTATDPEGIASIDSTFCIYKKETSLSKMKNNIFVNVRQNSLPASEGRHYTMNLSYNEVVTTDYNIYNVNTTANSGGVLARLDGIELVDLRSIQAYANNGNDLHSGFGSPNFALPNGSNSTTDLHLTGTSPAEGMGIDIATITRDYDEDIRSSFTATDIGADAGDYTFDLSVDIYTPYFTYTQIDPQTCGTTSVEIRVTIIDQGSGINETEELVPRVYYRNKYKDDAEWSPWTNLAGKIVSQARTNNVFTSEWTFTLTGLAKSNFYEYYFVAQDRSTYSASPNIGYSKFDNNSPDHTNVIKTYPDSDVNIDAFTVCVFPAASYTIGNNTDCNNSTLEKNCDFQTLTGAQDFFYNMNAMLIDKNVIAYIVGNTTEPATVAIEQFTESSGGPYNIRIRSYAASPQILTCTSTPDANMIRFDGGDRYTIDGQYYNVDDVPDGNSWLSFVHEDTDQSVFTFENDAQSDTIKYVTMKASNAIHPYGVIYFGKTTVALPTGNKNIVIDHNVITKNTGNPSKNLIYSYGEGADNSNISITNNEISEFQSIGIWATSHNNNSWTISDNTIYNTFVGTDLKAAIQIESGSGFTINNNKIGGSNINLGGAAMENDYRDEFNAIYLSCDNTVVSEITNNTIKNIICSESGTGDYMRGIYSISGKANITGNIVDNLENNRNNGLAGIWYSGDGAVSISSNTVSNLTSVNGKSNKRGIYVNFTNETTNTVDANIVKALNFSQSGTNVKSAGIWLNKGTANVTNNIVGGSNLADKITFGGDAGTWGIRITGDEFVGNYHNNIVENIEHTGNNFLTAHSIYDTDDDGITISVQNNEAKNISITNTGANTYLNGFYFADGSVLFGTTTGNKITGLSNSGTARTSAVVLSTNEDNSKIYNTDISNINGNGEIYGIYAEENRPSEIKSNTIHNCNIANNVTFTAIGLTNGTITVDDNKVEGISMTNTGANTEFNGIMVSGGTATLGNTTSNIIGTSGNTISNAGTGSTNGIRVTGGTATIENSIIGYLDGKGDINGIWSSAASATLTNNIVKNITTVNTIDFSGIKSTGASASIQANTIENIALTSTGTLNAIVVSGDNSNIGNTTANIIGNTSNAVRNSGTGETNGININGGSGITAQNNRFLNISGLGDVNCIKSAGTSVSILDHTINNLTIADNITFSGVKINGGSGNVQNITIHDNTVSASGNNSFVGIYLSGGTHTVSANNIYNISSASTNTSTTNLALQGVLLNGTTTATVSGNTIYNLNCTGASTNVAGVSENAGNVKIDKNKIYNIKNIGGTSASGILINNLSGGRLSNNMITLGTDSENPIYYGIYVPTSADASTKNIWFNSVCIKGTASGGGNSYAFYRASKPPDVNLSAVNLKNNIFSNFRTGGSNNHYAIANNGKTTGWTSNYNNLYSVDDSKIGLFGVTERTLTQWQTSSSGDANSFETKPPFTEFPFIDIATGDLHINPADACLWNGFAEDVGIDVDYDGDDRNTPTTRKDIGADEFNPTGSNGDDYWTGITDTDWGNSENWACELLPNSTTNVIIHDVTNDPVVIGAAEAVCNNLTSDANSVLTINSEQLLNVSGDMIINGTFNIKSDGSLLNTGTITGSGTAKIERYLKSVKYHYFTPPLPNQSSSLLTNAYASPYWNKNLYYFDETIANAVYMDNWINPFTDETPGILTVGTGYIVYFDSSPTIVFTGAASGIFTGTGGDQKIPIIRSTHDEPSKGWNLVGNPYPSAISADKFITDNSDEIGGTLYFWDDDGSGNDYSSEDYATWNGAGAVGTGAGVEPNGNISSMQAFFVKKTNVGTSNLLFNYFQRVKNTTQFYKRGNNFTIQKLKISLSNQKGLYNETLLSFIDDATEGVDRMYDGEKFKGNKNIALYSKLNEKDYAIQALPTLRYGEFDRKTIPIGFDITLEGEYEFNKVKLENFESDTYIYLEDRLLKNLHDLSQDSPYKFYTKSGKITERFRVIFSPKALTKDDILNATGDNFVTIYSNGNNVIASINDSEIINSRMLIYNNQGKIVFQKDFKSNLINAQINSVSGIYLIQIIVNYKSYSKKVYLSND